MNSNKLTQLDYDLLDIVFDMGGGYVLDFSDRTFSQFFSEELNLDIDSSLYRDIGDSKAKRLRSFWAKSNTNDTLRVIIALWTYKEKKRKRSGGAPLESHYMEEFQELLEKLGVKPKQAKKTQTYTSSTDTEKKVSRERNRELIDKLIQLSKLEPHPRGYAFEKFLKELFDAYGMGARASFRLTGEQIDGSFELLGETYLLEAKWQTKPTDASDLRSFNAKVEDKSSWSRGLFISDSGFTEDGLIAFGAGKSLICMDGLDLSDVLQQGLSLPSVLSKKARRAAETGRCFVRVRDLKYERP